MEPDYYAILGVPETASPEEVQEAYRRLAKRYHPDRSGADTASQFRAVQEAWETLGNPERRREYDRRRRPRPSFRVAGPHGPRPPGWDADPFGGSADDALHLELRMTPAEAAWGGDVAVELPAWVACWPCGGRGRLGRFLCPACRGRGRDLEPERFTLHVPAGLRDGEVVRVWLREQELAYGALVIHVRVR
jgi:DnaJ-class molecular chaperone